MMRRVGKFSRSMVLLACLGLLVPAPVRAEVSAARGAARTPAVAIADVQLTAAGTLQGQVLDSSGQPRANTPVQISQMGQPAAQTATDANGRFAVGSLRGGVYEIATPHGVSVYRVWTHGTAPPAAGNAVLLSDSDLTVRGNHHGGFLAFLTNPWVLGGIVAAAIVIPLALDDDDAS